MDKENVSATLTIAVPAAAVFAVLADPTAHASIDGTGWVQESVDQAALTEVGQIFRMGMYHHDLTPLGPSETEVTLTYDWSAVPQYIREYLQFPPFGPEHLTNSLDHLAGLAAQASPVHGADMETGRPTS